MLAKVVVGFLSCALAAQVASADTIRITSGSAGESVSTSAGFSIQGQSFGGGPLQTCAPCTPGAPFDAGSTYDLLEHVLLNGSAVMATGRFTFTSSHVLVPAPPLDSIAVFHRPFTFLGLVNFEGSPVEHRLIGAGVATIRFYEASPGNVHPLQIDYDFTNQQPVPEPATMLLVGSALAGAAFVRRRNQKRSSGAPELET